jgi:uncharacterized protein (UPF0305 family)
MIQKPIIEPTTIVNTKDKNNNQYVNNYVNKINNNLKQPKHNNEQQTSDNNLKQNTIDQQIKIMKITYTQSKNQHKHLEYMGMQYLINL